MDLLRWVLYVCANVVISKLISCANQVYLHLRKENFSLFFFFFHSLSLSLIYELFVFWPLGHSLCLFASMKEMPPNLGIGGPVL